jgi:Ca2+-transporting ATPase
MATSENPEICGLTSQEVAASRLKHGKNKLQEKHENRLFAFIKSIFLEPMVLLLLAASVIYFVSGEYRDATFLAGSILLIAAISFYQERRSSNALLKLKELTQPLCRVMRDGIEQDIKSEDLVVGDVLIVAEGSTVSADGLILKSNDFSVNESVLTGESLAVEKRSDGDNLVYAGTTVSGGLAFVRVNKIGDGTRLGGIGRSLDSIKEEKTPLEQQIGRFVKNMVVSGAIVFAIVWLLNYINSRSVIASLLKALTLAMSILPEEIPVAFTTFMALGAWRLMNMGVVVKKIKTVETLGSATVICTDKTGTLTENSMALAAAYLPESDKIVKDIQGNFPETQELITTSMWASEPLPFDPMEIALHHAYASATGTDLRADYKMEHEYPLSGTPPMMTHVFKSAKGDRIVAAKGAPEAILNVCGLSSAARRQATVAMQSLATSGYRVLGVCEGKLSEDLFPEKQQDIAFEFKGLVAFYDPPKKNIADVLNAFYSAGITVKIITGDNALTTAAIAHEIGFKGFDRTITGEELMKMGDAELRKAVDEKQVFSRMFPEAKLRIVNALKDNGHVVAMTGDGVNDGPALKAAHIGIAMGKKGTAIAKDAASLILSNDDLTGMVDAIAMGRKIYTNLKKAIRYIISIHIPIILIVFIPLAFGWLYPNIFSPLHVILLELIMGPTCSVIYENEPAEADAMVKGPRPLEKDFFNLRELSTSILQGIVIALVLLWVYQYAVGQHYTENLTRSMVFMTLMIANIFLTLVNRSFSYSVWVTLKYKNSLALYIITVAIVLLIALFTVPSLRTLFNFQLLTAAQLGLCTLAGAVSVLWYEGVKYVKRKMR